jgi:phosphoglycerate kinase
MPKLSIEDLPLKDKTVLMRVDFNVPLNEKGEITDDTRIKACLPSIQYILDNGAKLILMSHLGRPKGKVSDKLSLTPCAIRLSKLLDHPVKMAKDSIGDATIKTAKSLQKGEILLLENLRFYEAEEKPEKDPTFAKTLAQLGDVFINDAFGTAHRKHASTYEITKYFPNKSAAGFLLKKEIEFLGDLISNPKRPFFAIIGGAKISSKLGVIKNLLSKVDGIFITGGMAYTFFKAQGINIGDSICEDNQLDNVKDIVKTAEEKNIPLYLPEDIVIADKFSNDANIKIVPSNEDIPEGWQGMDTGPKTIEKWKGYLKKAASIFWNGPFGVFEYPNFAKGTNDIAQFLSSTDAITIIGGGDSLAAINALNIGDKFSHLSTGGGASLEYIEYGKLPGIEALGDKP